MKMSDYPTPGKWSVAWAEGDGIRWRYGDDPDDRIFDGPTAMLWTHQGTTNPFEKGEHVFEVDGDEVATIPASDVASPDELMNRVRSLLRDHAPE